MAHDPDQLPLAGRMIVVTGGTRGIGRMIADGCAAAGGDVIICARDAAACAQAAQEISARGRGQCTGFAVDLAMATGPAEVAARILDRFPTIHLLVNNAGTVKVAPLDEVTEADWDGVHDLNLRAAFMLAQALMPGLVRGTTADWPASIINIGSIAGLTVRDREHYAYAASKAALHHMTRVLAKNLAPRGVTVNAIIPGLFVTDLTVAVANAEVAGAIAVTPLRRAGQARDIAGLTLFLASPGASYVTGACIPLDGGLSG